ncbi:MAG: hypothetical protein KGN02_03465 [bacterium]|nr:hypothetical protein [bacterium]
MTTVYIGVAIAVVLIVAGFAFLRWQQNRELAAAYATPTPAPSAATSGAPTPTPIPLMDGETLGKQKFSLYEKGTIADSPTGGRGQNVDGIPCASQEYVTLHVHPHLAIFDHGVQVQVPKFIGAAPSPSGGCLYWVHTHNPDGIIHVEAPELAPPGGSGYTLGIFFDIWGQPLTRDNIAGLKGPVTAFVNGVKYDGDLRSIALLSHQQIVLEVGTPVVPPPNYEFPPND